MASRWSAERKFTRLWRAPEGTGSGAVPGLTAGGRKVDECCYRPLSVSTSNRALESASASRSSAVTRGAPANSERAT